jgi:pimeloyl-ACP methyl ester carboxylesterase
MPSRRSILRTAAAALLSVLLLLLIAGAAYQFFAGRRDLRLHPAPGRLIDIGGYRLHLNCLGGGSPTIVFDSGLSDDSLAWYKVQPALVRQTRACTYDRAGLGWSDPSPLPRTSRVMATELHTLLENAHVRGPYILVGHSLAGLNVRLFAALYPQETVGLVLVDSVSPYQYNRLPANLRASNASFLRRFGYFEDTMPFGWPRLSGWCDRWPAPVRDARRTTECRMRPWFTHLAEYRGFDESSAQVLAARPLANVPLFVLSHDPGVAPGPMDTTWSRMQDELAALSPHSQHVVVQGSGHMIQEDRPQAVIDAIDWVLTQTRTGSAETHPAP